MTAAHAPAHAALRAAPRRAAALRPLQSPRPPPCPTSRACPSTAAPCRSHLCLSPRPPPPPNNPKAARSRRPARPAPAIRKSHHLPANNLRALEETLRVRRVSWHCASLHCHRPAPSSLQRTVPPPAATTQSEHDPSEKRSMLTLRSPSMRACAPLLGVVAARKSSLPRINGSSGSR